MSKTFALLAAAAAFAALSSGAAFAATADSAPPGYVTWTDTPTHAVAHVNQINQMKNHMVETPSFSFDPYSDTELSPARGA